MTHNRAFSCRAALAAALLALALPVPPAGAQAAPSDSVLRGFTRTGDYVLLVGGKEDRGAEIYKSEAVPAYLILATALPSPVLLTPRNGTVETVGIMKIVKQADGTVDLRADAALQPQGRFRLDGERVLFASEGRQASLAPKPPLVGLKKSADLKAHSPEYVRSASAYKPNPQLLAALKKQAQPVRVRVVFGSWCPHCKETLPHLLRVEDELRGSKLQFEYFGLPRPPQAWQDPEVKRLKISGVPTAIVYVNGREIGRIMNNDWTTPEASLNRLLTGGRAASTGRR